MKKKIETKLRIDWDGFKENIETYITNHNTISDKMLCSLFKNYSEQQVITDELAVGDKVMVIKPCS
jgi:hypothetical protein